MWDASTSAAAQDGAGIWNISNTNWWNGTSNTTWLDGVSNATIGTGNAAGVSTLTLSQNITPLMLTFTKGNHSVISPSYTLNVPTGGLPISVAGTATLNTPMDGVSDLVKTGVGALTIFSDQTHTGRLIVNDGSLTIRRSAGVICGVMNCKLITVRRFVSIILAEAFVTMLRASCSSLAVRAVVSWT